ncbi:hypothetical protein [Roseateles albus]|uniref:Lipoprotein n=1 Tax=Roseateles albus TaxID=2987525 RepID=A0ABT5KFX3_9BURK|nr:hypothetical protein [Roseateles albus]MDC8772349.1 hypothetical protein [Roseateles albus]
MNSCSAVQVFRRSSVALISMLAMLALGACSTTGPTVIESSSTTMSRQADLYDSQAGDLQRSGAGRAGSELRRLADKQRLDAKNSEPKGFTEGAVDLLINSLFQSWLASSPKGLQK